MGQRCATRRVQHFHGDERLGRNVRDGMVEVWLHRVTGAVCCCEPGKAHSSGEEERQEKALKFHVDLSWLQRYAEECLLAHAVSFKVRTVSALRYVSLQACVALDEFPRRSRHLKR